DILNFLSFFLFNYTIFRELFDKTLLETLAFSPSHFDKKLSGIDKLRNFQNNVFQLLYNKNFKKDADIDNILLKILRTLNRKTPDPRQDSSFANKLYIIPRIKNNFVNKLLFRPTIITLATKQIT